MASVKQQVEELASKVLKDFDVDVVEVAYEKKFDGMNLTIYIDKKGGVCLDDCERVHRAMDEPLDELDPTNGASYTFNVSSAGLDREIKTDKDFERNVGEELEIKLYKKIGKSKDFVGVLKEFDQDKIVLQTSNDLDVEIDRKAISKATKYIRF